MKRVALLKSHLHSQGGLEKYTARIADGFLQKGFDVSFLTSKTSRFEIKESISIHTIKTCRWPGFRRMEQYDRFTAQWIEKKRPDIVFGLDRNRLQTHLRAGNGVHAAFLKSRVLTEGYCKWALCQINPLHRKIIELEKSAFESPVLQTLFTNSNMVKQEVLQHYQVDASKIKVVHNGVEWHEMQSDFDESLTNKTKLAHQLGLNASSFHFLFIGNGYLRKGLKQLLKGFASLSEKDIHLSILGKENRIEEYKRLAYDLNISSQVTFFGVQKDPRPFYQIADALIIPSFYDPFANVTVEALAMGLFVISSKTNGGSEVLTDENGILIEDLLEIEAMKEALSQALKHPKTKEKAQLIRQSVRHLDFSNQIPQLIEPCCVI